MSTKEVKIIKAITVRFSDKLHKAMKYKTLEEDIAVQQYVIDLIKNVEEREKSLTSFFLFLAN